MTLNRTMEWARARVAYERGASLRTIARSPLAKRVFAVRQASAAVFRRT